MEWSYNGNDLVKALENKLQNEWKGDRVYVVGDYALSSDRVGEYDYEILKQLEKENGIYEKMEEYEGHEYPKTLYSSVEELGYKELEVESNAEDKSRYIYIHDKKQYIDLEHCPLAWFYRERNQYHTVSISPLTLSLALGNGMGGGDFFNEEKVGFVGQYINNVQNLEITEERLNNDYEEYRPEFYEGEYIPYEEKEERIETVKELDGLVKKIKELEFDAERMLKGRLSALEKNEIEMKSNNPKLLLKLNKEREENVSDELLKELKPKHKEIEDLIYKHTAIMSVQMELQRHSKNLEDYREDENAVYGGSYSWSELYKNLFKEMDIDNVKDVFTEDISDGKYKTTIVFDNDDKAYIESKGYGKSRYISSNLFEVKEVAETKPTFVRFAEGTFKIPKELQEEGLHYFNLRDAEDDYVLERNVTIDHIGSVTTDKDILKYSESQYYYKEIFNNPKYIMVESNEIREKVNKAEDIIMLEKELKQERNRHSDIEEISAKELANLERRAKLDNPHFLISEKKDYIFYNDENKSITWIDNKNGKAEIHTFKDYDECMNRIDNKNIKVLSSEEKEGILKGYAEKLSSLSSGTTFNESIDKYIVGVYKNAMNNSLDINSIDKDAIRTEIKKEINNIVKDAGYRDFGDRMIYSKERQDIINQFENSNSNVSTEENENEE